MVPERPFDILRSVEKFFGLHGRIEYGPNFLWVERRVLRYIPRQRRFVYAVFTWNQPVVSQSRGVR